MTLRSIISNFYTTFIWEFSTQTYNILIWDWGVASVTTESRDKTRLFPYALLRIIKVRLLSLLFIISAIFSEEDAKWNPTKNQENH
jgi:hypothetical protein